MKTARMARVQYFSSLIASAFSAALLLPMTPALALEALDDGGLAEVSGAGIAFLPEDAFFVFRGAGANEGTSTVLTNRLNDTGYIRLIPVGPLTSAATTNAVYGATTGKADIFLYGLAMSRADGNLNSRLNGTNPWIKSWGTPNNPWLLKVQTDQNVPNFAASTTATACDATICGPLSYLALEAPLFDRTLPTTAATGADAYNLKLAMWGDIFNRRPDVAEGGATQFDVGGTGRANRLRLQMIWDDFSLNGTVFRLFQTLGGATAAATNGSANNTFYNNTLGLAGVLRMNSGDTTGLRATVSTTANTRTVQTYTMTWDGNTYGTAANYTNTSGVSGGGASAGCNAGNGTHRTDGSSCTRRYQTRATIDSGASASWTAPTNAPGVLRISTRESGAGQGNLVTPALSATAAPTFDASEGMYFYGLNVNLVLGTLAQPLIAGKADGAGNNNLVFEIARIPNKPVLYSKIYTQYRLPGTTTLDPNAAGYTGLTCSVHYCGAETAAYQGSNATHSSITIGSTVYDSTTRTLSAYSGAESVGVSFGALPTGTQTATVAGGSYRDVQVSTRNTSCGTFGCSISGYNWNGWSGWSDLAVGQSALYNLAAYSPNTWTEQGTPPPPPTTPATPIPTNNLGSVAIDGLLIQHLKFTTTGL